MQVMGFTSKCNLRILTQDEEELEPNNTHVLHVYDNYLLLTLCKRSCLPCLGSADHI